MCFSETQSYIHTALLLGGAAYTRENWRLAAPLAFLSIKDFLQGLLYRYEGDEEMLRRVGIWSYIHIAFQPLFVNMFMSHFDPSPYYDRVMLACLIFGLYWMTTIQELDVFDRALCDGGNFCRKTGAYQGEYHVAYRFQGVDDASVSTVLYMLLTFFPGLFTKSRNVAALWGLFVMFIAAMTRGLGLGEFAAMWCSQSILFYLPIALWASKQ